VTEYRASFDAALTFSNGGDLAVHEFRVDVPSPNIDQAGIAALFVASLGLLMTETVELRNVRIFAEPHKGTRGGPADRAEGETVLGGRLVELSHVIRPGLITYPGLPGPVITPYLTREASRTRYAPGTEFAIDVITMVGNTGTYLDSPFHRYPDADDLSELPLDKLAELDGVKIDLTEMGPRAIGRGQLVRYDCRGKAVLIRTGWDRHWGTNEYFRNHPFLTADAATYLAGTGAVLVGIDSLNIDDTGDPERPVHSQLLAAGIPICEHLANLGALPADGFRFSAVPPKIRPFGTFPVRAYATW